MIECHRLRLAKRDSIVVSCCMKFRDENHRLRSFYTVPKSFAFIVCSQSPVNSGLTQPLTTHIITVYHDASVRPFLKERLLQISYLSHFPSAPKGHRQPTATTTRALPRTSRTIRRASTWHRSQRNPELKPPPLLLRAWRGQQGHRYPSSTLIRRVVRRARGRRGGQNHRSSETGTD